MGVNKDIQMAKSLIGSHQEQGLVYNKNSFIYKCSNERMNHPFYNRLLTNNKRSLSVIASGDQILNQIHLGTNQIDAFDISRFPKYYLKLKIAAVKVLEYEEYLGFFYDTQPFDIRPFQRVMDALDEETRLFWTSISLGNDRPSVFKSNGPRVVYESKLFSGYHVDREYAKDINPYLVSEYAYLNLKHRLNNIDINYFDSDVLDLPKIVGDKEYDLVYLSNIVSCAEMMFSGKNDDYARSKRLKNIITNFNLGDDGKVVNYMIRYLKDGYNYKIVQNVYNTSGFKVYEIDTPKEVSDAVLVYRKK